MFATYSPSGSFGPLTIPLAIAGVVAAALLAFIYQLGLHYIPLIYVNVLLTVGMGLALGTIGNFIVQRGHCRNVWLAGLLGILLATTAISAKFWFQYQSMMREAIQSVSMDPEILAEDRDEYIASLKQQLTFAEHIKFRLGQGWALGRGGQGGLPITGWFVVAVWLLEAGMIFYNTLKNTCRAAQQPYSEKNYQWASESQVAMVLPITDEEMVSKIKSASSVEDLLSLPIPQTDVSTRFAIYTVNSIPGQELEDAYLSVDNSEVVVNRKGEAETKVKPLVKFAILSSSQRKQLLENAELLNEALADYRASKLEEALNAKAAADKAGDS